MLGNGLIFAPEKCCKDQLIFVKCFEDKNVSYLGVISRGKYMPWSQSSTAGERQVSGSPKHF